jgi:hypothetical protein
MKKKITKKLSIGKETIADLNMDAMNTIRGGGPSFVACTTLGTLCCKTTIDLPCK